MSDSIEFSKIYPPRGIPLGGIIHFRILYADVSGSMCLIVKYTVPRLKRIIIGNSIYKHLYLDYF